MASAAAPAGAPRLPPRPRRRLAMEQKERGKGRHGSREGREWRERERRKGKGMEGGAPLEKDGGGVTWCVGHMGSTVTFRWERSPGNSSSGWTHSIRLFPFRPQEVGNKSGSFGVQNKCLPGTRSDQSVRKNSILTSILPLAGFKTRPNQSAWNGAVPS